MTITALQRNKSERCYHLVTTQQLYDQVARFWKLEECKSSHPHKTTLEDTICEEHFNAITTRNEEGRFMVSIPLRENVQDFEQSKERAHQRWLTGKEIKKRHFAG